MKESLFLVNKLPLRIASLKEYDVANGPGVRVSIFVQGCPHHCEGCFNPESWAFKDGELWTEDHMNKVLDLGKRDYISGLSVLGGEPIAQNPEMLCNILKKFRDEVKKPIWLWTGYVFEELMGWDDTNTVSPYRRILDYCDVVVDGPFVEAKKNLKLVFRGSSNQRVINVKKTLMQNTIDFQHKVYELEL